MPFITIIIPTYNRKELLEKAVLSVLSQDQSCPFEYEIIIIDDGSGDGTEDYMQQHITNPHSHITYRYQKNGGVGSARNHGISLMNQESDYLIFLDSDDELRPSLMRTCLEKWEQAHASGEYESILGFYFLCEDENGNIIGNRSILGGASTRTLTYDDYLSGIITHEMGLMTKSSLFLHEPKLRFEEDITTEGVMWAKMWKYMGENSLTIHVLDTIGRLYKTEHTGEIRITKTLSGARFRKNAIGNERLLEIIRGDLEKRGLREYHRDLLMRTGLNWILADEKKKGLSLLVESLRIQYDLKTNILLCLAWISPRFIHILYGLYV